MSEQGLGEGPLEDVCRRHRRNAERACCGSPGRPADYVLRRGPRHLRPRSNSVILRETKVLAALAGSDVPHPHLIAGCRRHQCARRRRLLPDGPGRRFNAGDGPAAVACRRSRRAPAMGLSMADALAKLAAVDHVAVGLADFGKPEGFLERQVAALAVGAGLLSRATTATRGRRSRASSRWRAGWTPTGRRRWTPGIMHGDYHAANVMFSRTRARAWSPIVDWEMCTIGDPLLDLGWLLATWRQPDGSSVFSHAAGRTGRLGQHRRAVRSATPPTPPATCRTSPGTPCWPVSSWAS